MSPEIKHLIGGAAGAVFIIAIRFMNREDMGDFLGFWAIVSAGALAAWGLL